MYRINMILYLHLPIMHFIIWPVIYFCCIGFVIYQWVLLKDDSKHYIKRAGIWFTVSNIANALWCYCWVHEWLGWSVIIILIQLISLPCIGSAIKT